jgi:hypothetical protein
VTLALAPTGSALGDFEQLFAHDAAIAKLHTRPRSVEDPALRDALEHFDTALTTPICDRTRRRATTGLPETFLFGWGTTSFDVVSTITKQADQARQAGIGIADPVAGRDDAVSVVEDLTARLGLPEKDVLTAAGISKSTFHTWKKPKGAKVPRPRVASQGRLWALAQAVEDLEELLDGGLRGWLLADATRVRLLRAGDFDALLRAAEPPASLATAGAPAYAAAYAVGGDRTDPEVTEVAVVRRRSLPAAPVARRSGRPR